MTRLVGPGRPDWPRRGPLSSSDLLLLLQLEVSYREARERLPALFGMLAGLSVPELVALSREAADRAGREGPHLPDAITCEWHRLAEAARADADRGGEAPAVTASKLRRVVAPDRSAG